MKGLNDDMISLKLVLDYWHMEYNLPDYLLTKRRVKFLPIGKEASSEEHFIFLTNDISRAGSLTNVVHVIGEAQEAGSEEAVLVSDVPISELCQKLQETIEEFDNWVEELLMLFRIEGSVSQLISILNQKIKNPIIIFDASYKILGYSDFYNVDNDPEEWGENIQRGYVSLSKRRNTELQESLSDIPGVKRGDIYELKEFDNCFFCKSICHNREKIGMFLIIDQVEEIDNFSVQLVQTIFFMVEKLIFLKQSNKFSSIKSYEYLLKDLIFNDKISTDEINERLRFEKYKLKSPFAVCVIAIKDVVDYQLATAFYLNININFFYSEYQVFLLERFSEKYLMDTKKELRPFLKQNKTIAGISTAFKTLSDFRNKYQESIKAIYFNAHLGKYELYNYRDYVINDFFAVAAVIKDIEKYLYTPVIDLMKKDKVLFDTLNVYIKQKNSQKATSVSLGIHRTTLIYRLNKIRENYLIDYDNSDVVLHIIITVRLLEEKQRS